MHEEFKKGAELLSIGVALQSVLIAANLFLVQKASTYYEAFLLLAFLFVIGIPIWVISMMAIVKSVDLIFPDWRFRRIIAAFIHSSAMIIILIISATTDVQFYDAEDENKSDFSYGIHSVHHYDGYSFG